MEVRQSLSQLDVLFFKIFVGFVGFYENASKQHYEGTVGDILKLINRISRSCDNYLLSDQEEINLHLWNIHFLFIDVLNTY